MESLCNVYTGRARKSSSYDLLPTTHQRFKLPVMFCQNAEVYIYLPSVIMRPSSLGGGRIMRRTLSVRLSVCLSVCLSVRPVNVTERHVAPSSELQ